MREAVIVSAVRTAVGRAKRGMLIDVRPDEMASVVIKEVLNRAEPVKAEDVEDVILGCSWYYGLCGWLTPPSIRVKYFCPTSTRKGWSLLTKAGDAQSVGSVPASPTGTLIFRRDQS